ncbi:thiamine phosphate synthase [Paucilactobacillus suebicus]|uniref:Thiamine-phosphate synthase n=1 Tax=Paucilactobacillus suebicus DSM 5007 = KCTC 3549 TaxID=1423807 RepID=A0A0R1WAW7_9LACO|nr:thiamine phosphate synthase [Paucilactobacillus suebicus]KRM12827.1 thiamine-phosphate pyrophosphorylase [Paucilactobacillus suebicus DSM 5007 = KCTC 3549]
MEFNKSMLKTYLIAGTSDVAGSGRKLSQILKEALEAGITSFQYREKGLDALTGTRKIEEARFLMRMCHDYNVPFIIDNDIDLANEIQADGIHVGQTDTAVQDVIKAVGTHMFVGLSCHTRQQVLDANEIDGISYIGSGAIYPSLSKHGAPVIGLDGLRELVEISRVPIVAIGGINDNNIFDLPQTGVAGASVISMITRSNNVAKTITLMNSVEYK